MLSNRSESSNSVLDKVENILGKEDPSLVSLKLVFEELKELHSFYSQQNAYVQWTVPPFPCSLEMLVDLKGKIIVKIEIVTKLKADQVEELRALNKNFLSAKSLPKISHRTWSKFLQVWFLESPSFHSSSAKVDALQSALSLESDRQSVDNMESEEEILKYLYLRSWTRILVFAESRKL